MSIRKTGDYLDDQCVGRFTEDLEDLRSLGRGTKARRAAVMYTPGNWGCTNGKEAAGSATGS